MLHLSPSEDKLQESILSFHLAGCRDQTQATRPGSKGLYLSDFTFVKYSVTVERKMPNTTDYKDALIHGESA